MKWFQVDADTPNDPRIRAVIRELGSAGFGGLVLLWCHIADHGDDRRPGWSLDSSGRPMDVADLVDASRLPVAEFDRLVAICIANGHFHKREWERRRVIAIPAMARRADTYTKRRVRTRVEQSSTKVPLQDSTNNTVQKNPPTPLAAAKGARLTRKQREHAEHVKRLRFGKCLHDPACASHEDCLRAITAERRAANQ